MNAKILRFVMLFALVFVFLGGSLPVRADTPADILGSYTIAISPQPDGTLVMNYTLQHYCTYSDWPSDTPYLQIGVPNGEFSISDWGLKDGKNKVTNAESITSGGSFVQLDFDGSNLPKNGDCFDLNFSIVQNKMAYPDDTNNQVTFKFIPAGWSFPIQVKTLTVTWALPSDQSLLKVIEPNPMSTDGTNMIWQWASPAMSSSGMFSDYAVKIAYDKTAFTLSDAATTKSDSGNGGSSQGLPLIVWIVIIVVVVLIVVFLVSVMSDGDGYGGGGGGGIGGIFLGGGGSSGGGGHSGGGGLGSGGGGSSCACAGCACACACAGGGKVGCSRKGIGIACLPKVIKEEEHEDKDG